MNDSCYSHVHDVCPVVAAGHSANQFDLRSSSTQIRAAVPFTMVNGSLSVMQL